MGLYEQIRDIAKAKGYSVNRLEHELGFARSSINKFNKNKPSVEKVRKIADFLDIPMEALMGKKSGEWNRWEDSEGKVQINSPTDCPTSRKTIGLGYIPAGKTRSLYCTANQASSISESIMPSLFDADPYDLKEELDYILYKLTDETIFYDGRPLRQEAVNLFLYDLEAAIARLQIVNQAKDLKKPSP